MLENLNLKPTILVSPLPWGLGHAARCIPIITELLSNNCHVIICATGESKRLLSLHFPNLQMTELRGYNIRYSSRGSLFSLKIASQIPALVKAIVSEHYHLKKLIKLYKIDVVISDNRPGLFNRNVRTIYITHQLRIKTGLKFTTKLVNQIHHFFIKRFKECWIPDDHNHALSGELSYVHDLKNVKYIHRTQVGTGLALALVRKTK